MRRRLTLDWATEARRELEKLVATDSDDARVSVLLGTLWAVLEAISLGINWADGWSVGSVRALPFVILGVGTGYVFFAPSSAGRKVVLSLQFDWDETTRGSTPVPEPPESDWEAARERWDRGGW